MADELDMTALDALRVALDQASLKPDEVVQIDAAGPSFIVSAAISESPRDHVVRLPGGAGCVSSAFRHEWSPSSTFSTCDTF